jgi:hypothetical protein
MSFVLFLVFTLAIPFSGFLLLKGIFGRSFSLSALESFAFAFALGIGSLDFSMIFIGKIGLSLTGLMILAALAVLPIIVFMSRFLIERASIGKRKIALPKTSESEQHRFNSATLSLFLVLIGLTIFLKAIFLVDAGLPTATDLGHHMYWSKMIVDTGQLPEYSKTEIIPTANDHVALSDPQPISDFIIGEHLPFAAIAKLSGASFFSAFPVSFLLFVNIISLLALFCFSFRLAETLFVENVVSPITVGLAVLFFAGPLFAFSSPEAKFVSGGVVGNLFGNMFIPLVLLSFLRAYISADSRFLALGILLSFTLAYTHHLSSLVLAFILLGIAVMVAVFSLKHAPALMKRVWSLLFSPAPLLVILFVVGFLLLVAMPTYIDTNAVTTAVGTPSKATRTGLSFLQATQSTGAARMAIGLSALLVAVTIRFLRRSPALPFILGWSGVLLIMALRPHWLFLDIPSNRIGTYLSFPFAILSGLFLAAFPILYRDSAKQPADVFVPGTLFLFTSLILFSFSTWNGSQDNQSSLPSPGEAQDTLEVFSASKYIASRSLPGDLFLKDHNYLVADSWMKLFFMRDYAYPLSRGYFKRYEDEANPREQCTLRMISVPNLPEGRACYSDLGVNLVAINPAYDMAQFEKSRDFSLIYSGTIIQIYERKR